VADFSKAIIVGAGPAGIATAIQLRRSGVDFMLFEERQIGGLLLNAHLIENYPGFPLGISGPDLVERLSRQLERWEIQVIPDRVKEAEYRDGTFFIQADRRQLTSHVLVVASGTAPQKLPGSLVPKSLQDRVFYEIHPLKNRHGQDIAIIGAGDAAFDYALSLAENNHVTILCRDKNPSCLSLLSQRTDRESHINIKHQFRLQAIEKNQDRLALLGTIEGESQKQCVAADYLLIAIGRHPSIGYLAPSVTSTKEKLVRDGILYFVGDVNNGLFRQTGICVGDGIRAAMQINRKMGKRQP